MTVKELKEALANLEPHMGYLPIFYRKVSGIGNIQSLGRIEVSTYSFFGEQLACLLLEPDELDD